MSDTGPYKVVGRSAALAPEHYGKTFAYDESDLCSGGAAAAAGAAAVTLFGALLMFPPTRWALGRGLHSFTSQRNLSAFYGIGGARTDCVARVKGVFTVCGVFLCVRQGSS